MKPFTHTIVLLLHTAMVFVLGVWVGTRGTLHVVGADTFTTPLGTTTCYLTNPPRCSP